MDLVTESVLTRVKDLSMELGMQLWYWNSAKESKRDSKAEPLKLELLSLL